MSKPANNAEGEAALIRALRALSVSGRRLHRMLDGRWGVMATRDMRRRPVVTLSADTVARLAEEGRILPADEETFVVAQRVAANAWPPPAPRAVFLAACARRPGRTNGGIGFAGLAMQARDGKGPLLIRHVQAGLRLVADAERAVSDPRMTMNWDAGPVTRQRRAGVAGGPMGDARSASRLLRRIRAKMGDDAWRMVWSLCIDAEPLAAIRRRFAIAQKDLHQRITNALETLATAYSG